MKSTTSATPSSLIQVTSEGTSAESKVTNTARWFLLKSGKPNWVVIDDKSVKFIETILPPEIIKIFDKEGQSNAFEAVRAWLSQILARLREYILSVEANLEANSKAKHLVEIYCSEFLPAIKAEIGKETNSSNGINTLNEFGWVVQAAGAAVAAFISEKIANADLVDVFKSQYKFEKLLRKKCPSEDLSGVLEKLRQFCICDEKFKGKIQSLLNSRSEEPLAQEESKHFIQAISNAIVHYVVEEKVSSPESIFAMHKEQKDNRNGKTNLSNFIKGNKKVIKQENNPAAVTTFFNFIQKVIEQDIGTASQKQNYFSSCFMLCKLILDVNLRYQSQLINNPDFKKDEVVMVWVWEQLESDLQKDFNQDPLSLPQKLISVLMVARDKLNSRRAPFGGELNKILNRFHKFDMVRPDYVELGDALGDKLRDEEEKRIVRKRIQTIESNKIVVHLNGPDNHKSPIVLATGNVRDKRKQFESMGRPTKSRASRESGEIDVNRIARTPSSTTGMHQSSGSEAGGFDAIAVQMLYDAEAAARAANSTTASTASRTPMSSVGSMNSMQRLFGYRPPSSRESDASSQAIPKGIANSL